MNTSFQKKTLEPIFHSHKNSNFHDMFWGQVVFWGHEVSEWHDLIFFDNKYLLESHHLWLDM